MREFTKDEVKQMYFALLFIDYTYDSKGLKKVYEKEGLDYIESFKICFDHIKKIVSESIPKEVL